MPKYQVKIEASDGTYDDYIYFSEQNDEDANAKCYDLADKGWYKLYKSVNFINTKRDGSSVKGCHWIEVEKT